MPKWDLNLGHVIPEPMLFTQHHATPNCFPSCFSSWWFPKPSLASGYSHPRPTESDSPGSRLPTLEEAPQLTQRNSICFSLLLTHQELGAVTTPCFRWFSEASQTPSPLWLCSYPLQHQHASAFTAACPWSRSSWLSGEHLRSLSPISVSLKPGYFRGTQSWDSRSKPLYAVQAIPYDVHNWKLLLQFLGPTATTDLL